jgi:hypothetical protein
MPHSMDGYVDLTYSDPDEESVINLCSDVELQSDQISTTLGGAEEPQTLQDDLDHSSRQAVRVAVPNRQVEMLQFPGVHVVVTSHLFLRSIILSSL